MYGQRKHQSKQPSVAVAYNWRWPHKMGWCMARAFMRDLCTHTNTHCKALLTTLSLYRVTAMGSVMSLMSPILSLLTALLDPPHKLQAPMPTFSTALVKYNQTVKYIIMSDTFLSGELQKWEICFNVSFAMCQHIACENAVLLHNRNSFYVNHISHTGETGVQKWKGVGGRIQSHPNLPSSI